MLFKDVQTPAYSSKRSVHRLFRLPEKLSILGAKIVVGGLEIRFGFNPAYSVAPPSDHAAGCSYTWIEGQSIEHVGIADFPDSVIELTETQSVAETVAIPRQSTLESLGEVPEGNRHNKLCSAFGTNLKKFGHTPEVVEWLFSESRRLGISEKEVLKEIYPIAKKECANTEEETDSGIVTQQQVASGC